jgi:hypothetical protein
MHAMYTILFSNLHCCQCTCFSTGLALAIMHVTITRMLSSVLQTVYDKIYYEKTNFRYLRTE